MISQIQSQLEELARQEAANQQEQEATNQHIKQLEINIKEQYRRQSELDDKAIQLYAQGEELKLKLEKLQRINALSQEFRDLQQECQDNQELLQTLHSSISLPAEEELLEIDLFPEDKKKESESPILTLQKLKNTLPNAELIYKKLLASNVEKYQTYQNLIIDEFDVIWCSVAFIAFGRDAYRQLSFKHHPDLNGSEQAMQLINTAWEISEEYIAETSDMAKN